jgi:hypothetical protein
MDLRSAFLIVLNKYDLKGSALAKASGLNESQISVFRSGQRDIEGKTLIKLLNAMPPEARLEFCACLAGQSMEALTSEAMNDPVEAAIVVLETENMTDDQVARALKALSNQLRQSVKPEIKTPKVEMKAPALVA